MSPQIDREKTKQTIALVLDKIRTEADPWLLDDYCRLFKKEVSLFNRTKAAAYLLMAYDQGKNIRVQRGDFAQPPPRRTEQNRGAATEESRRPMAEEESMWLFFGAGRSRRVFPREILGLINTKTAIPREDIGAIRILENYSFVQVRNTVTEKIIDTLNGTSFRGRPLTVNYAKSRKNEDDDEYSPSLEQDHNHSEEEDIDSYSG